MINRLNQFISNIIGQFIEVSDRTNIYQCMDLAYTWVFCLGYPKATIQQLYASRVYTQPNELTRQYFDLLPNTATFIPQDGDICVFSNKVLINGVLTDVGHIGVALGGGTVTSFRCFEQNWPIGTHAAIRVRDYNTPKLLGVLRPKNQEVSQSPAVQKVDLSSLDNSTALKEIYGVLDIQTIKAKFIAKDSLIKTLKDKITQALATLS